MPVERLLAGAESVDMPDGSTVDLSVVRDALAGRGRVEERDATAEELERAEAGRQDRRKVAGSLGISVNELDAMAYRLWGRSFWAEKEARVGDVSGLSKRSAQTKRGHSTRSMITDLREWMEQQNG